MFLQAFAIILYSGISGLFPYDPWETAKNKIQGGLLPMCWPCNSVDQLVNRTD